MNRFIEAMELKNNLRAQVSTIADGIEENSQKKDISDEEKIIKIIQNDILLSSYNYGEIGFEYIDGEFYVSKAQLSTYRGPIKGSIIDIGYIMELCEKCYNIQFDLQERPVGDIKNRVVLSYSYNLPKEISNPALKPLKRIKKNKLK